VKLCKMCEAAYSQDDHDFCGDNCEMRWEDGERTIAHLEKAVREEREAVAKVLDYIVRQLEFHHRKSDAHAELLGVWRRLRAIERGEHRK
jgi:hypothetical protein